MVYIFGLSGFLNYPCTPSPPWPPVFDSTL